MNDRYIRIKNLKKNLCPVLRKYGITPEQKVKIYQVIDTEPYITRNSTTGTWGNEHVSEFYDKTNDDYVRISQLQCSVCGRYATKFTDHISNTYCPHCGAYMRGEQK